MKKSVLMLCFAAIFAACVVSAGPKQEKQVWRKGAIHTHTLWSDGRSLPEVAVQTYKDLKYDFMCITEHNVFPNEEYWFPVAKEEGKWPPNLSTKAYNHAQKLLPGKLISKIMGVRIFVKLRTFKELQEMFNEKDKFVLIPGEEITNNTKDTKTGQGYSPHFNTFNLAEYIPAVRTRNPQECLDTCFEQYQAKSKNAPEKSFFMVNHPHAFFWDIDPVLLVKNPQITHFEICNGALSPTALKVCSIEKFWDFILAHRLVKGDKVLYATASDDTHFYLNAVGKVCGPDTAWVMVNTPDLTPESITKAMIRGDFYASCGVELEKVIRDDAAKTLTVKVKPEKGVKYTISFIVTKKNFDRTIVTRKFIHPEKKAYNRDFTVVPENIGITALTIDGTEGSYTLKDDDLYVRAIVSSDQKITFSKTPGNYPGTKRAWTQPLCQKIKK
ncbi:MAG: hypothetical protein J6W81_09390 [Lentisphaeria bacterium]|nr:hypothetical protein [Lentisphaeria bacterium]